MDFKAEDKSWECKLSETIHKNPWFSYQHDQGLTQEGKPFDYYYFRYHHAPVSVVGLTKEGKIILVRQYRYLLRAWSVEIPGGQGDSDNMVEEARREFFEETGYRTGELKEIGRLQEPGHCHFLYVYLAFDCVLEGKQRLEGTESGMEVFEASPKQIWRMISSGEICDSMTLASLMLIADQLPKE